MRVIFCEGCDELRRGGSASPGLKLDSVPPKVVHRYIAIVPPPVDASN
jgi:hypothetical protein